MALPARQEVAQRLSTDVTPRPLLIDRAAGHDSKHPAPRRGLVRPPWEPRPLHCHGFLGKSQLFHTLCLAQHGRFPAQGHPFAFGASAIAGLHMAGIAECVHVTSQVPTSGSATRQAGR